MDVKSVYLQLRNQVSVLFISEEEGMWDLP